MSRFRYVALGALGGLTWASALRGWMAQLTAGASSVSWPTFVLVLLPGVVVGALLGWAAYLRSTRRAAPRWLIFAPVVFAAALLDPVIFAGLIRNGTGGGSLLVVATALAGGFVLSRRGFSMAGAACGLVAVLGLLAVTGLGSLAAPITSARGAWVGLSGLALMLLLGLASALPYPTSARVPFVVVGALGGLAWAGALRAFMSEIAGPGSAVDWAGTFGFILLPGVLVGVLIAWSEQLRRTGEQPRRWLTALSPLLFGAVVLSDPLDFTSLFADGVGGGAIGVPVIGILGGYAVAGRSIAGRVVAGSIFAAGLAVWVLTAETVGGAGFAPTTPHGLWATVFYWSLLISLALATAIPMRAAVVPRPAGSPRPVERQREPQ